MPALFTQQLLMNYQKLDAALAMALNDVSDPEDSSLVVFIHTEPLADPGAAAVLANLGVSAVYTFAKCHFPVVRGTLGTVFEPVATIAFD